MTDEKRLFRAIHSSYWKADKIEEIPLRALSDWVADDNNYSIYKINDIKCFEEIKKIVLRLLICSINKRDKECDLFILLDSDLDGLEIYPSESNYFETEHFNIKRINYSIFKKMISLTFKNISNDNQRIIKINKQLIGDFLMELSDEKFTELVNTLNLEKDEKEKRVSLIKRKFFKGSKAENAPKYLGEN